MAMSRRQAKSCPHDDDGVVDRIKYTRASWSINMDEKGKAVSTETNLAELLTNQRWHEIGNGPPPISASSDFTVMVEQISAILSARLRDLLVWRMLLGGSCDPSNSSTRRLSSSALASNSISNGNSISNTRNEVLRFDRQLGDYVLVGNISELVHRYVTCIGRLYNEVGFHSFEHCAHVTISMNKLLSIVSVNKKNGLLRRSKTEELNNEQDGRSSNNDKNESFHFDSITSDSHRRNSLNVSGVGEVNLSFGIGEDPRILFAMVFAALIHDVGHTGVPNSILVEEEDERAILHNDVSVAEQNSLHMAFSMLQQDDFAELKLCICPTPEERRFFRKKVIAAIMATDIADQERVQVVTSRWNAAFPPQSPTMKEHDSRDKKLTRSLADPEHPLNKEPQSKELKSAVSRRRFTMFSTDDAVQEFKNETNHFGIHLSMDFTGMLLNAYRSPDQLKQAAVLDAIMNVADVAHTMQSFRVFVKWNKRLFREFYVAHAANRLAFDPAQNWYQQQIGFFTHYIIPNSQKMKTCGVFGHSGNVFEYFASENLKRWIKEGEELSERIIRDVKEEVELGIPCRCLFSTDEDK